MLCAEANDSIVVFDFQKIGASTEFQFFNFKGHKFILFNHFKLEKSLLAVIIISDNHLSQASFLSLEGFLVSMETKW